MSFPDVKRARKMAALAVGVTFAIMVACLLVVDAVGSLAAARNEIAEPEPNDEAAVEEAVDLPDQPFYVLLIGSDSRKGTALYTGRSNEHAQVNQHSDIMTLVRVDLTAPQLTLVTIPRDTQLEGSDAKINEALAAHNDPEDVVAAVEQLTGVEVPYYMMTTFMGFEQLVDGMDGVQVDVPQTVTVPDPATATDLEVRAGSDRQLDGAQALVVARARKEYAEDEDALRQVNVRNLEVAIIEKGIQACSASGSHGTSFTAMLDALMANVRTNMDDKLLAAMADDLAHNSSNLVIYSGTGPYKGDVNDDGLWVVPEDAQTWAQLMETVGAGGDPASVVPNPEFSGR